MGSSGATGLRYGLTWRQDSHLEPGPEARVALTIAGLQHVGEAAAPLLNAFVATVLLMVEQQRQLVPSPSEVVEATVTSAMIAERI